MWLNLGSLASANCESPPTAVLRYTWFVAALNKNHRNLLIHLYGAVHINPCVFNTQKIISSSQKLSEVLRL